MTEGFSSDQENANLYARGVTEGLVGKPLDGKALLEILDVFGVNGLRTYITAHVEGAGDTKRTESRSYGVPAFFVTNLAKSSPCGECAVPERRTKLGS
jgi:hypothetical protein